MNRADRVPARRPRAGEHKPSPSLRKLVVLLALFGLVTLACGLTDGQQATALPAVPDQATAAGQSQTATSMPTVVVVATAAAATPSKPTDIPSTQAPAASPTPAGTTTPVATQPTAAPDGTAVIDPGQSVTDRLDAGAPRPFTFNGTRFQPVLLFAEGDADLDLALATYEGTYTAGELAAITPVGRADLSAAGRPELMVFTPQVDGVHTVAVQAQGPGSGQFTLYLFDGTTQTAEAQSINDRLAMGQSKSYPAQSNGGRPVIVFVDPTDQANLAIIVTSAGGNIVAEADYGGVGSAEALFLLPLQSTAYTVTIRETGVAETGYNLLIISLN